MMKYYKYGSLSSWIGDRSIVKKKIYLQFFMRDVTSAIQHLHKTGIAHCDLKTHNVLIDYDTEYRRLICVLTDFGIAQLVTKQISLVKAFEITDVRGFSVQYCAPETFSLVRTRGSLEGQSPLAWDIYSLGATFYEIITRTPPWY